MLFCLLKDFSEFFFEKHLKRFECNQNCQLHSQKDSFFLSPERAATYQPRATPWVNDGLVFSPERALHKKSDQIKHVTPFQG
jgi:hypothetical protein